MRTHRAKSGYLPAEYIPPTFWLEVPSPFCTGWRWGLLSRKFFLILFFWFSLVISEVWIEIIFLNFTLVILTSNIFLFFSDSVIVLVWFWLPDYRFIISIFNLIVLTRFGYAWLSSSTCLILARYSLSVLRYILLASISTCFSIVDSTL